MFEPNSNTFINHKEKGMKKITTKIVKQKRIFKRRKSGTNN